MEKLSSYENLMEQMRLYEESRIQSPPSDIDTMEGFWYEKECPFFPMPKENTHPHILKEEILKSYDEVCQKAIQNRYRGSSTCRCCGVRNGCVEFEFNGWKWPEGYRHYLDMHNVIPSKAFLENVLNIQNFIE